MISCFSGKLRSVADERDSFKRHQTDSQAGQTSHRLHPLQEHPQQPLNCSQICEPAVSGSLESLNFFSLFCFVFYRRITLFTFSKMVLLTKSKLLENIDCILYVSFFVLLFLFSRDYKDWFVLSYIKVNYYLQPLSMKHSLQYINVINVHLTGIYSYLPGYLAVTVPTWHMVFAQFFRSGHCQIHLHIYFSIVFNI